MKRPSSERGSAVLTTVVMIAVIMGVVTAIMAYANAERLRTISISRKTLRLSCAESGLQFAKAYFGRQFSEWNAILAQPGIYDPIYSSHHQYDPMGSLPPDFTDPSFQSAYPQLFADLDADSVPDIYIYSRDNQDEFSPAFMDPLRDNDQNLIVGAACFSKTLRPRGEQLTNQSLTAEGLLSHNSSVQGCSQFGCGDGSGNLNN